MPSDRPLLSAAERNHGILTDAGARRAGFTLAAIRHRLEVGRWERAAPGVLRVAGTPRTWEQSLAVAVASLGPRSVVSHRSAAALWGFAGFPPGVVELTAPHPLRGRRGPWHLHSSEALPQLDRVRCAGFPLTSATRTLIDLAAVVPDAGLLGGAIDGAVHDRVTSIAALHRRIAALRGSGRAGVRLLDALLLDGGGHSHLERAFLRIVRIAGLPRPRCQVVHRAGGAAVARVDFEWPERSVVVEVGGQRGHASERERAKDARRHNALIAAGYQVYEFTTSQVLGDPGYVLATLRPLLE